MANFNILDDLRKGSRILYMQPPDSNNLLEQIETKFQIQSSGEFILSFDVCVDDITKINKGYYFVINGKKLYLSDYVMNDGWETVKYKFTVYDYVENGNFIFRIGETTGVKITNISLHQSNIYIGWTPSCQDMLGKEFYTKIQILGENTFVYKDNFNEFVGPDNIKLEGFIEAEDVGTYIWQIQTAAQEWISIYNGKTNGPIVPIRIYPSDAEMVYSYPKLKDKGNLWMNGNLDIRLCYEYEQEFYYYKKSMNKITSSAYVATANIKSSNGNFFKPGLNKETFLTAEVYYNGKLVELHDQRFTYYWEKIDRFGNYLIKYSDDFEPILAQGEEELPHTSEILINTYDVFLKNTFNCKVARIINKK